MLQNGREARRGVCVKNGPGNTTARQDVKLVVLYRIKNYLVDETTNEVCAGGTSTCQRQRLWLRYSTRVDSHKSSAFLAPSECGTITHTS